MEINSKLLMNFINDLLDYGLVKANKLKLNIESFRIKSLLQNIAAVMALQAKVRKINMIYDV